MPLHGACILLLSAILFRSLVPQINAAPATYDQRQNGDFNVDAKFENFLVVVATSGSSSLFSNLASQALELNELIAQRSKQQTRERPSETMVYESEDADGGREPYHVEIVRIEKDEDSTTRNGQLDKLSTSESNEKTELGSSSKDEGKTERTLRESLDAGVIIDIKKTGKKTRSLWKSDGPIKASKKPVNIKNTQMENLDHPDDLPVKEEASKAARPGLSLKKQLSKKEEVDDPSSTSEEDELSNKYAGELVLIGDGIENCGPGRRRNKYGLCEDDENFY
ncbi:uncharacterized protein LOC143427511 [Xylocopa sonorina]|uniref:uncharacterized protein LOC143427511 n=1 Tax=Xylocopa sonorina TaxID=1818115 RepID=UPI00403A82E3